MKTFKIVRVRELIKKAFSLGMVIVLCLGISPILHTPEVEAADSAALANSVMTGAMGMAVIAATDTTGSLGDCLCKAEGASCPMGVAGHCVMMGLNIATMVMGIAQAMSAGDSEAAVAQYTDEYETPEFDPEAYGPPSLGGYNTSGFGCDGDNPSPYLCSPGGLDLALNDLNKIPNGLDLTAEQIAAIENSKKGLEALSGGDTAGALAAFGNEGEYTDIADSGSATGGTAAEASDNAGSTGTAGVNSNFAGTATGDLFGDGGGKGVGRKGAKLGPTEWNGRLDQIDKKTGKSLTLWQRATRRFLGTPSGKRGFTLARIEKLRRESTPEYASKKRKEKAIKKAALAKQESKKKVQNRKPALVSPKALFGH